jgi:hypothetical protein
VLKGYLLSAVLLLLGLAGVGTVALQASRSLSAEGKAAQQDRDTGERVATGPGAADAMGTAGSQGKASAARRREEPARAPTRRASGGDTAGDAADAGAAGARPSSPGLDAAVPAPAPDAAPAPSQDAAAPLAPDAEAPAARVATGPPPHPGPKPVVVLTFEPGSSRPSREHRRALREMVRKHGYKDVYYEITAYAADKRDADDNRLLARRRCRWVYRLIHKRGPSRRWLRCKDPVYRKEDGPVTEAYRVPAWRRVEIRTKKQ